MIYDLNINVKVFIIKLKMSKAYYYCKNFSFKEVNNLFAYGVKNPATLTQQQRIVRLYKYVQEYLGLIHYFSLTEASFAG